MKKIILLLFLLFLPFEIINLLYKYSEYTSGDNDISRFKNVPYNIQIANSGNSLGEQMDYSCFPEYNSFKFSMLMQPINYDFHILNQYADHFAKDSIFVIVLSYGEVDSILSDSVFALIKNRYYQFLKAENIEDFSMMDKIRACAIPVVYAEYPFTKICNKFFPKPETVEQTAKNVTKKCGFLADREAKDSFIDQFNRTVPRQGQTGFEYNKNYTLKMIRLCNQRNIHPVVVTPPLPKNTVNALKESDYFEVFENLKASILEECKTDSLDINWIDFNRSAYYINHEELFKDPVHLKDEYSAKYTEEIILAIKELGLFK